MPGFAHFVINFVLSRTHSLRELTQLEGFGYI